MKIFCIFRIAYVFLFLLTTLPASAYYHRHTSAGIVFIGILLMLILIPLTKFLFYAFVALLTNKWTWIIGGGLLFLVVLINKDNEQKKNGILKQTILLRVKYNTILLKRLMVIISL